MPPRDDHSEAGNHPDMAGWVLDTLDHDDAASFAAHLHECADCRAAVAELKPVARAMAQAAPALEPPADLGARTVVAVQQAAAAETAERKAGRRAKVVRFPRWRRPGLLATAAVAATAAIAAAIVVTVPGSKPAQTAHGVTVAQFRLHSPAGGPAGGEAIGTDHGAAGWSFHLSVHGLPMLPANQFYECWYVTNPAGHPKVSGGTFTLGPSDAGTFTMRSAADPHNFKIMWITKRRIGEAGPGTVVLTGVAQL
jgi:Anti-sigma-K factor rskA